MPANVVKSPADEKHWKEAKSQAAAEGHPGKWAYVMGIFQRMKHHLGGAEKGQHPWRNEALDVDELLSAILEYDADIPAVVDGLTETHWPAVPTYNVVVKPKPKPAPKPQVNPNAHGSMPKAWKGPVTEGLESHVMRALETAAPHLKAGVHYHFSDGLNAAPEHGPAIADALNQTGEFARARYNPNRGKVEFHGSGYGKPRRSSLPCGGCGGPTCGYCA